MRARLILGVPALVLALAGCGPAPPTATPVAATVEVPAGLPTATVGLAPTGTPPPPAPVPTDTPPATATAALPTLTPLPTVAPPSTVTPLPPTAPAAATATRPPTPRPRPSATPVPRPTRVPASPTPRPVPTALATATSRPASPTPRPASPTPPVTPTPAAPPRTLQDVILVDANPPVLPTGDGAVVHVRVRNVDTVAHTLNLEADFYSLPLANLGTDPSQYLITTVTTPLTLAAGSDQVVTVNALSALAAPPESVAFRVLAP